MASQNIYEGPGTVIIDGSVLVEAGQVRVRVTGNKRRVYTMRKGLSGRSRGPVEAEITVDNPIPRAGMEQEFVEKCVDDADVRVVVVLAGKRYQYEGWIDSVDHSQSTQDSASVSFTVVAGPPTIR